MKINQDEEPSNFYGFQFMMVMQCQLICEFRELLNISPEDFAKLVGKETASSISKMEARDNNDGYKYKMAVLEKLEIDICYYSGLTDMAMNYYRKHREQLIGNKQINRVIDKGAATFGDCIEKKCREAEHFAMRIACLIAIAEACSLKVGALEQAILQSNHSIVKAHFYTEGKDFENSVLQFAEVKYFLKRKDLMNVWGMLIENNNNLRKKNKQILAALKNLGVKP